MKKYIVLIAVLPLLAILMSCNEGGAKADLRKMVDNINRECPIHYDYITCQSAAIQGEEVVMNYIVDESMLTCMTSWEACWWKQVMVLPPTIRARSQEIL